MRFWSIDMHFRTAQETWTPTDLTRTQETAAMPVHRERDYIWAKIREHEMEIARRAEQIRLLRLELNSEPLPFDLLAESRCAGLER
jgi:hypothetical protein